MCGIAGFFGIGDSEVLRRQSNWIKNRGPDGEGYFIDESLRLYLAHRRLAIRDIDGGAQPILADNSRYVLTFNGEIYNDVALKIELENRGHQFTSKSDSEVLLRFLMEWGAEALERIDGPFAFCFVDRIKRFAVLARDRYGEKPLFWAESEGTVVFASDSTAVVEHPTLPRELDEENCIRYLLAGYLAPPHSVLKGVHQVRPGHFLQVNLAPTDETSNTRVMESRFALPWHSSKVVCSERTVLEHQTLDTAVHSRRVSDVPVGLLLSGGIDSSLVAQSAIRLDWRPDTYTVKFGSRSFDESQLANDFAANLGLQNFQVDLSDNHTADCLNVLRTLDEPLGDSSYIPSYHAFKRARTRSKVVLTGDGADEFFFGYEPYRALGLSKVVALLIPPTALRILTWAFGLLPRSNSYMNRIDVIERFLDGVRFEVPLCIAVWMSTLRTREFKKFFSQLVAPEDFLMSDVCLALKSDDPDVARKHFLSGYLPGSVLHKSDRASMANGVESRAVFFHPDLVSFALSRTEKLEIQRKLGKQSLRRLLIRGGYKSVALRPKHGFALPLASVFAKLEMECPQLQLQSLRRDVLEREWARAIKGKRARYQFLWAALSLSQCRAYRMATNDPTLQD